jgi:hypothetical protein
MNRNHRQNDHAPYDNRVPAKRQDDYRPATLRRFWEAVQDLAWKVKPVLDWIILAALGVVLVGLVVMSVQTLAPIVRSLIG